MVTKRDPHMYRTCKISQAEERQTYYFCVFDIRILVASSLLFVAMRCDASQWSYSKVEWACLYTYLHRDRYVRTSAIICVLACCRSFFLSLSRAFAFCSLADDDDVAWCGTIFCARKKHCTMCAASADGIVLFKATFSHRCRIVDVVVAPCFSALYPPSFLSW